jgi:WD40 repeat protein
MNYLYGLSHGIPIQNGGATTFKSYKDGYIISFSDVLRVYDNQFRLEVQIEHIKRHSDSYITSIEPNDEDDSLYVGYSDGYLCKYQFPGGLLVKQRTMPFRVTGVAFDESNNLAIVWGSYCELWFLDQRSLDKLQGMPVNDWPMAVPLLDGKVLSVTRSGQLSEYIIRRNSIKEKISRQDIRQNVDILFGGPVRAKEPVVDVKRVGEFSWVVAQKYGWVLLRWQSGELMQEISSGATSKVKAVITCDENDTFGVLEESDKVVWVSRGQVVPVDPIWPKEARLIGVVCREGTLLALVEDTDLVFYSCALAKSFEWVATG